MDREGVTGCCDRIVAMALTSALVHYPDAIVLLWSNDLSQAQVQSELVKSDQLRVVHFNETVLAHDTPAAVWLQGHEASHFESVKWSDLFRYMLMYLFGGR